MYTYKAMVDGVGLTNIDTTYYTTPTNTTSKIFRATFCNDDITAIAVTITLVKSGSSASYESRITKAKTLAPGETWSCPDIEGHVLEAGGFISMVASITGKIGCRISGIEMT